VPKVQIETNLILMMPSLIFQTELLTFTSRRHVDIDDSGSSLREVRLKQTTMRRQFDVAWLKGRYLSPAAQGLIALLRARGKTLFSAE
jgi:DNA-binding transcriptional LysR family regulator